MAGNVSRAGATVTSRALALIGAFDAEHRRLSLTQLAERADLPVPTAHRLVAELVDWGALSRTASGEYVVGRRLWDVGLLAPVNTGTPAAGLAVPARPLRRDARHRAPGRPGRHPGALPRPALRARVGARGQHDRLSAADARHRCRQGAARARAARGAGRGARATSTRVTPYTIIQPGTTAPAAGPGAEGRLRDHGRGDEPRRLLGRGSDPGGSRRGRVAGDRRAHAQEGPGASWSPRCR